MSFLMRVSMTPEERRMYQLAAQINKAVHSGGALWQASVTREYLDGETFAVLVIHRASPTAPSTFHTITTLEQFERIRSQVEGQSK